MRYGFVGMSQACVMQMHASHASEHESTRVSACASALLRAHNVGTRRVVDGLSDIL
jgi:hypothetical protein